MISLRYSDRRWYGRVPAATLAVALGATQLIQPALAADPDLRVARALNAEKLEYKLSDQGNYRVVISFDDKRSQLVIVNSGISSFRGGDWRDVYATAFEVKGDLSQQQANDLLKDSDTHVFGGWCISKSDDTTTVFYQTSVPADAPAKELHNAISLVAIVADEMEKKITSKDDN